MMLIVSCGEKITNNNGNDNGTVNEGNNGNDDSGENGGENGNDNGNEGGQTPELTFEQKLLGEWYCPSLAVGGEAYLNLMEDKTFELYQKIGEGAFRLFRGTWNLEDTILSGKYNDGEDWAASYEVSLGDGTITITSQNDAAEESTFTKTQIPEDVKDTCVIVVKSGN